MELDLNSSVAKSLRLQFNVDMDVFETDEQFESEMNACMQRTLNNLNGKGFIGEVTAILDSGQSGETYLQCLLFGWIMTILEELVKSAGWSKCLTKVFS